MTDQLSLLEGERRKDEGIRRVLDHNAEWADKAWGAIRLLAVGEDAFTSVEVVEIAGEPPHRNAIGGILNRAAHIGIIVEVGMVRSPRPPRHAGKVAQWKGVR